MAIKNSTLFSRENRRSLIFLAKWSLVAIISGVLGTMIVRGFEFSLNTVTAFLSTTVSFLPLWTLLGALICGLLLYRLSPGSAGEGIPSYLKGLHRNKGILDPKETFFKFFAAFSTLATFGNGGIVGPLGRVVAGLMSFITKKIKHLKFNDWDVRTATICGLAATIGTIFHSSIGGGIFAVEIVQKSEMRYRDLFPAILSSSTAVLISKTFGWSSFYPINAVQEFMSPSLIWILLVFSLFIGFAGKSFTALYTLISKIFKREQNQRMLPKVLIGSLAASVGIWFLNPALMGTSKGFIGALFTTDPGILYGNLPKTVPLIFILIIMAVAKAIANCVTVGSGMSAGFTGPAALIGMLLGAAWAQLFQFAPGSPNFTTLIAAGFAGMLGSTMNIPIAAAILTIESFGLQYSFPAGLAAIIAFQVNRRDTIYSYVDFRK